MSMVVKKTMYFVFSNIHIFYVYPENVQSETL